MNNELVSIIIPNYNRASLIGETLDSIIAQSYQNWECIIVDDGSTDDSVNIIDGYCRKDHRIRLIQRPCEYPKGANACRNIGKNNAKGHYIIFFDSDDLMTSDHVEQKVNTIASGDYDFAVAKTECFNHPENKKSINYRKLNTLPITADNFITKKINWLTLDPIYKAAAIKNINFTEKKQSAEEYNFFCKLVLSTVNATLIDKILSLRRYHEDSVQTNLDSVEKVYENNFYYYYDTYFEIKSIGISDDAKKFILNNIVTILYKMNTNVRYHKFHLCLEFLKVYGIIGGLKKIYSLSTKLFFH